MFLRKFSPLLRFYSRSASKKRDPYDVLGVSKTSPASAIKKAYLGLVKQFHPDTNKDPSAKDKFVEVQAAYDILSDDQKRASYDAHGFEDDNHHSSSNYSSHPDPADIFKAFFGGPGRGGSSGNAFDPFADIFGHRTTSGRGKNIPEDIQLRVSLTFLEAALGCTKTINVSRWESCHTCSGSGITPGSSVSKCKGCGGKGAKVFSRGGMVIEVPCDTCDGTGSVNPNPCKKCSGEGIHKSASPTPMEIRIPAGVDSSTQLVMEGMGNNLNHAGSGRSYSGNLILQFRVADSPIFKREGNDIYQTAKISLITSLLGGTARLPSLDGELDLLVAPCSIQPGDIKRLKGKGIYNEGTRKHGDMYVTLQVELPASLTTHQKSLLKEWNGPSASHHSDVKTESSFKSDTSTTSKLKDWIREKVSTSTGCADPKSSKADVSK